jgi:1,4-alpha-glucan branching enzyme
MFTESYHVGTLPRYSAKRNLHRVKAFCHAPEAEQVSLIGDFNNWEANATPMLCRPDGQWMASLELRHGYHQYVFLVDGKRVLNPNAAGRTKDSQNQPVSLVAIS